MLDDKYYPLIVTVKSKSITVDTFNGFEVCHWVEDEWLEDPTIIPAIANAIHLAHTRPEHLTILNLDHILPQIQIQIAKEMEGE